jgi:anti-anti-sigma regulatory factor
MLRITTHHNPDLLTIQLEGKLAGPWVQELADCWQRSLAARSPAEIRLDLKAVTFVDAAGKELLTRLHTQHAQFVAAGCLMKAIVAEISQAGSS